MADEIVQAVDPKGDVVLVLRNPNAPFAVWEDTGWVPQSKTGEDKSTKKVHPEEPALLSHNTNVHQESETKLLLSSRHLILASHYFDKKLNGTWKEATPHPTDGRYHLEASDWDSDALLILMNVIHGRTRSVPRHVDCEMLAKIAVLVDYYKCHEVVEVYSSIWIDALKNQLPSECTRDLVLWLLIAYVFRVDDVFASITKTAVLKGQGPMPTMDLPIPPTVIDLIDWRRQHAIAFILNTLGDLLVTLRKSPGAYNDMSTCMTLGALDRAMYKEGLLGLSEPYLGHGVTSLETTVRGFDSTTYDPYRSSYHYGSGQLSRMIEGRLDSKFAKNKEGFSLAEVSVSDVSRR
ncbi:hypothetical protein CGRA01v4_08918 [Colletotrichum graminicola]|uniref:BTB domain-containing protein n=1 Tax=Colletotrichum graminicola (strain M1.001 / M2 / FGSC 10212) TaxID=645133 RepID=E3Q7H4_COLGM|nr:uncharacterized protein GLRG_02632 [Colletotrichum graminicola M1.001]EFQ26812.1 hypothetical protein GLRG_02632 [Colletotrichum graminicola M1.001]WDK17635.1 hypothetical protein CGRA01v4_08918 [Colletotrichum graminicola]